MEILGLMALPGWLVGILLLVFSICLYSWYKQSYFRRLGIKQKPTVLLFGDLFLIFKKGFGYIDAEIVQQNGKCFGSYIGNFPALVISDPEMLKEIMVKQFPKFTDRTTGIPVEKKWDLALSVANGEHWKFLRHTLSPTFSSGKMRHKVPFEAEVTLYTLSLNMRTEPWKGYMCPYIHRCLDNLLTILEENMQKQGDGFDINPIFRGYTMEVICSTGFGVEVDAMKNTDNPYVKYGKEFLDVDITGNPLFLVPLLFPFLRFLVSRLELKLVTKQAYEFYKSSIEAMISERREDSTNHRDLLQLMLNVNKSVETDDVTDEGLDKPVYEDYKRRGLTDQEVLINSIVFMIAGYDTTATTLCWLIYDLSLNPEVQEKLLAEIDAGIGQERPTYDNAFKLEYLDMVVKETLRVHPPVTRMNRQPTEDVEICGVPIEKGMDCTIAPVALHYLPEFWPDPHKYDPERFSPENQGNINPFTYLPFGNGPRNCVGKRLALLEVKMTIISLLQRFKVVKSSNLKVPMPTTKLGLNKPEYPLYIKIERRNAVKQ